MTDNTWTQRAGMTSDTETDNVETYAEQAEASKVAAAASETAAAGSASSASTSAATATTKAAESASSATQSASSATASAASATQSASSATASANSATTAGAAQTAAETAKTGAETAQTAAETAQTAAETAETNAATSEAAALASKNAAATSATNSSTSATNSANSATASETSRVASVAAQAAAETAETNAETAETNAAASASAASTSASNASTSETNAATSASTATTQAGIATAKAGEAATSATASANSATASEAAKDAALAALDSFDDRYLGAKASDPTLDNDGNALVSGALYFNTTDDVMKVYEGSQWVAAYASLSGALLVNNNLSDVADAAGSRANLGLGTAATTASTDYATAAQGALAASATQPGDLATVATSGAYSDLSGTPTLGTAAAAAATDFVAVTGDTMTGDLTVPNVVVSGNVDGRDVSADGTKLDGIEAGADVTDTANVTAAGAAMETGAAFTGDVTFGDNDKAIFGAGSDLEIYHTGGASVIKDAGVGDLYLAGSGSVKITNDAINENMAVFNHNGSVDLYYDNSKKLATTSTGIDVTGTVTADGLTVEKSISSVIASASGTVGRFINNANSSDAAIVDIVGGNTSVTSGEAISALYLSDANANGRGRVQYNHQNDNLELYSAAVPRLNIANNGDISFYEDTGTTPKFFWDASAESLGIGTSSPDLKLDVSHGTTSQYVATFQNTADSLELKIGTTTGGALNIQGANANNNNPYDIGIQADGGNVGIETTSPGSLNANARNLVVGSGSGTKGITVYSGSSNSGAMYFADGTSGASTYAGSITYNHADNSMSLGTNGSEAARLDASGNLLVGHTSAFSPIGNGGSGVTATASGQLFAGHAGPPLYVNREDSDGDIAVFRKDGSTVGSIGTVAGDLTIGEGNAGLRFDSENNVLQPHDMGTNASVDDQVNLGTGTNRFKSAYFSSTVNAANFNTTSDATLKTNVETLSGSLDAVKSLRGVSFDWLENGGSEIGVIAQEVEAVLPDVVSTNDEGIKSVKYGNMVAVLIEAIKEQQLRIEALEAKLGE